MTNTSPIQTKRLTFILILGSLAALGPLSIDMYLPAFPDMSRSFGASASSIQLSLTACMLGMALGQIIVGPLSDVRGRKRPLLLALFAYLLTSLACAFAPTIEVLIALAFRPRRSRCIRNRHLAGHRPGFVRRTRTDEVFCGVITGQRNGTDFGTNHRRADFTVR